MIESRVFINYRRSQNSAIAGRIYDRLSQHFVSDNIFLDVDAIAPGQDFVAVIDRTVSQCDAFIAVIGPDWVFAEDQDGARKLHRKDDYVRLEIEAALEREIPVIPVLVDNAVMPDVDLLPESLRPLTRRQAVELSHARFSAEADDLAQSIATTLGFRSNIGNDTAAQSHADRSAPPPTLAHLLFGFDGRLSRGRFWKGFGLYAIAAILMGMLVGAFQFVGVVSEAPDMTAALEEIQRRQSLEFILSNWRARSELVLTVIPLLWPYFALLTKRLHDLNIGKRVILPYILFYTSFLIALLLGYVNVQVYQLMVVFSWTLLMFLGIVEGTRGPNRFGPDAIGASGYGKTKKK